MIGFADVARTAAVFRVSGFWTSGARMETDERMLSSPLQYSYRGMVVGGLYTKDLWSVPFNHLTVPLPYAEELIDACTKTGCVHLLNALVKILIEHDASDTRTVQRSVRVESRAADVI